MKIDQEPVLNELHSLRDFVRYAMSAFYANQVFYGHGTDNAWDEAVQLVLNAVHLPWNTDPAVLDARLTTAEKARVLDFLRQRVETRLPLPYITKEAWWLDMPFYVDERVLIPRSPIGELIVNEFQPWLRPGPVERVLDLCTGSGCIGIGCAYAFPEAEVDLVDLSRDALDVARMNIVKHGLGERVTAIESDLFIGVKGQRYDLIVSNPPYVDQADFDAMPDEYGHEPEMALLSGDDGLDIPRQILRQAPDYLTDEGLLVLEVGNSETHLMEQYPQIPFTWLEFENGGHGVLAISAEELKHYRDQL